ncbi:hypothetical protein QAD02_008992 [Eretmocerus hayati]|uniref:Uncharacterized protein n=1 Tax=Eretmocerus hayati TaxID=131215 RepID=A0ACC2N801_9HYME|nr:hypothetical protein QAD02_008992 [Eretmocerus hayati]
MNGEQQQQPRPEFALGSEVSPTHFFKSSFARSFVNTGSNKASGVKSLHLGGHHDDIESQVLVNGISNSNNSIGGSVTVGNGSSNNNNNNFYSLVHFSQQQRPEQRIWTAAANGIVQIPEDLTLENFSCGISDFT